MSKGNRLKPVTRCAAVLDDGTQCSKYARKGNTVCDKHDPNYVPTGIIAQQAANKPKFRAPELPQGAGPEDVLAWNARYGKPADRMRAIELQFKLQQRDGCPACKKRKIADQESEYLIRVMTPEERERFHVICEEFRELKKSILAEGRPLPKPKPAPVNDTPAPIGKDADGNEIYLEQEKDDAIESERHQSPRGSATVSVEADERPGAAEGTAAGHHAEGRRRERVLPTQDRVKVGLIYVNGKVTHALGDDHARKILSGEIPYEIAREQHEAALREARLLAH